MAKGYDLVFERLWDLEITQVLVGGMEAAFRTVRPAEYRFKLCLPADAPPTLNTEWRLISTKDDPGTKGLDTWQNLRTEYGDRPDIWSLALSHIATGRDFDRIAKVHYPDDRAHKWASFTPPESHQIPRTFPCMKHTVIDGRTSLGKKDSIPGFSAWCRLRIHGKWKEDLERRRKTVMHRVDAIEASEPYRAAYRAALEELAVEELASRMVHFSQIPNVIERASKLFVVKDVMER